MKFDWFSRKSIRQKLGIGFGIVIGLIVIQGIITCILLFKQKGDQYRLANSYIPTANAASQLQRLWNQIEYDMDLFDRSFDVFYANKSRDNIGHLLRQYNEFAELTQDDRDVLLQNGIDIEYIGNLIRQYNDAASNYFEMQEAADERFSALRQAHNRLAEANAVEYTATRKYYYLYGELCSMINGRAFRNIESLAQQVKELSLAADDAGLPASIQDDYSTACETMNMFFGTMRQCKIAELKHREIGGDLSCEIKSAADVGLDLISALGDRTSKFIVVLTDVTLVVSILVIIISLVTIFMLSRSIILPINSCIVQTEGLAAGDLSVEFETGANDGERVNDEIGRLQISLNRMVANLRRIVLQIKESSQTLNESCQSLKNGAAGLAEGASEQATAAEEVAASMEKISENIRHAAAESHDTGLIATHTSETIMQSKEVSERANEYVADIIRKISAINSIATQTNILALNANVEAARAGSEGKGFAVVANAVRNLANKTQEIANGISESSNKTYKTANDAMKMIAEITPEIQRTAKLVMSISLASNEQVMSIDQINDAMRQLNDVTQRNAASADAISYETNKLKNMSNALQDAISEFYGI